MDQTTIDVTKIAWIKVLSQVFTDKPEGDQPFMDLGTRPVTPNEMIREIKDDTEMGRRYWQVLLPLLSRLEIRAVSAE